MKAGEDLETLNNATLRRLGDIDGRITESSFFKDWASLTFADLQAALNKRFKVTIPIAERDEWEAWFERKRTEAATLKRDIVSAEGEINERVYGMFGLTRTEIDAVEDALAIMAPALNVAGYEAISAVEGLHLSGEARERLAQHKSNRSQAHAA
jgi:acyl carrier protein